MSPHGDLIEFAKTAIIYIFILVGIALVVITILAERLRLAILEKRSYFVYNDATRNNRLVKKIRRRHSI